MERPQGNESTEETQETSGCGGQMHLLLILKLCLVLIHTLKKDEAGVGWNRSLPYTVLCGFIFFCSFIYSQPQFENVTWNVLEIDNS